MSAGPAPGTWLAIATGAALGLIAAAGGLAAWRTFGSVPTHTPRGRAELATEVALFRSAAGPFREMLLVPAGPDANGEPALSRALYPGEEPPRELASLLLANVSPDESWTVDLTASPLACRRDAGEAWEPLLRLGGAGETRLGPADRLRLRSLGTAEGALTVEPGSLRRVLLALPPRLRIADLSDVQWGTMPLTRDRLELERVRRFREDPAAVTTGR